MKARIFKPVLFVLALAVLLLAQPGDSSVTYAQSAKKRIEKNRQKRDNIYDKVKQLDRQAGVLSDEVDSIEGKMDAKEKEISSIKKQLALAEEKNKSLEAERTELTETLGERQSALGQRMRAIYMQGDMGYLDLIFHAASFGDLIDRVYFIQAVCESDEKMISEQKESQVAVSMKIDEIQATIAGISEMKSRLQGQYDQLKGLRADKTDVMEAIENDKNLFLRQVRELEQENKRLSESIRAIRGSASAYKGTPWAGSFKKPCAGTIMSGFGYRIHPIFGVRKMHTGVDIANDTGTRVNAAGDGKVIQTGRMGGYGNAVVIDHGNGRSTLYGHLNRISCSAGDIVKAGDKIGEMGSTGYATGPHCHFEVRINGDPVNPLKEL